MKVLVISCSPRAKSSSLALAQHSINALKENGIEVEIYHVRNKKHQVCAGCMACVNKHKCILKDDMIELHEKMKAADGILMVSPVYFYDVNAQCKIIIDRSYAVQPLNGNKLGASIITAGSLRHMGAINTISNFFLVQGIANLGFVSAYNTEQELSKGIESAKQLGIKMVEAIKLMQTSEETPFSMHNHYSYGTHTF
ncbi:flavodoxin family protein [Marinifilum caeruleilacunae]|uniref:Flavodoxin family protein n=1 Tax=Marinifilum caeruleilacunae TaxID=2499076 RepID=A0ABX1WQM1_9BACT|nr:flavodoxin family protein [Marinifilum caeruleilacunae]NOU58282.1 flavodoxin family protein [Marinifilum caeruleilacunae]